MTIQAKNSKKQVPPAQSIQYICERADHALQWLRELENEFQKRKKAGKDCYEIQTKRRIVADIISVYVTTLVDSREGTNSLVVSYPQNEFVKEFNNLEIVKKCQMNRHHRSAHESKSYGYFVSPGELLESNLKQWMKDIVCFVCLSK